ncbi:MAG: SDR family oxidoreductase [Oscillospiraceae bacterium]|nr:SDR family oxidoreductase [Oscillospiraceae bacterium]
MKHVLITGGSRGIGRASVELFCQKGYQVSFLYQAQKEKAEELSRKYNALGICCDVADGEGVRKAIASLPPVDILINNAGQCHYGLISQITSEEWDRLFAVNVKGIYHCVNAVLPGMLAKQQGAIINVASMWGQVGASCEVAYSATKGAVIALTKALAQELGPSGIRVNCISPGVILTDMVANVSAETLESLAQECPLGRNGNPMEIAEAMLYLAEASFITGQNIGVNGGFVLS